MVQAKRWLPLRTAAGILGVDEATLRHWADLGRVRTFRTPGGHRRFLEEDIRALLAPAARAQEDVGAALRRRTIRLVSGLPARRLRAAGWFAGLDEQFRAEAREYGRKVVDILAQSVAGPDARPDVGRIRTLGREYATALRRAGLSLEQATEAFVFFRDLVLTRALPALPAGEGQARALRVMSRQLDEMLLVIVRAYAAGSAAGAP